MANALYDLGRQAFLEGAIDYLADDIKCALVRNDYVPNLATDDYYDNVNSYVVGTPVSLSNKTSTNGVADADNLTFTAVTGTNVTYLVLYQDTGVAATSHLIALWDTVAGLPYTPTGADVVVAWDNGASKIFKL